MHKKITLTLEEDVYDGLHQAIGRRKISKFIETLVRPYVAHVDLDAAYKEMAKNEKNEKEAEEWAEALIGDVADESR